jgi:hypothetical protein
MDKQTNTSRIRHGQSHRTTYEDSNTSYYKICLKYKIFYLIFIVHTKFDIYFCIHLNLNTVKHVYKEHTREHGNMSLMSCYPLYTGYNYMHCSLIRKIKLHFTDSNLLYIGVI